MIGSKALAWVAAGTTALLGPSTTNVCPLGSAPGSAQGDVVLISAPTENGAGTDYVLFLDEMDESGIPDGQADRVFRLQTKVRSSDRFDSRRLSGVRVDWRYGEVRVKSASESEELTLALGEQVGNPGREAVLGYGLSNTRWRVTLPKEPTLTWYSTLPFPVASLGGRCDNGGPDATACGVDCGDRGCSVACDNGKKACCSCGWTGPRCYCK